MKIKNIIALISFIFFITLSLVFLSGNEILVDGRNEEEIKKIESGEGIPIEGFTHAHGLSLDPLEGESLYIATHEGLVVLKNDKDLFSVSKVRNDLMGFQGHPQNPKIFFSSGHPKAGGNLGFQKSEDGGITWNKISDGVNGPADFHALSVSPVNPDLIYGFSAGALQRSLDGGKNFKIVNADLEKVIVLTADTKQENTLYAGTTTGIYKSLDKGKTWSLFSLEGETVSMLSINPKSNDEMIANTAARGLIKTTNGRDWESIDAPKGVLYTAYSKLDPKIVYIVTSQNKISKSLDGGKNWKIIK